jgi:hypothetical protein
MSGFHDQRPGARSHALRAGGHTSSGAFEAPGKRSLTQGLGVARGSGPIQLQSDGSSHPMPANAFVAQYGSGSEPGRFNDCGPSCILMALRAMGVEHKLVEMMPAEYQPLNDQNEVKYICYVGFNDPGSYPRSLAEIQHCMTTVLHVLGVTVPDPDTMFQMLGSPDHPDKPLYTSTNQADAAKSQGAMPQGPAGEFIKQHCTDGSAVMVLGHAKGGPWGWGGTADKHNTQSVDEKGDHIVLVWRPDQNQDKYTVMDPSWTTPRTDKPLQDVIQFMYTRDGGASTIMNVMAIPYAKVAELVPHSAVGSRPRMAKRGSAAAAPVEDAGAGAPLPEPTRFKLQDLFGADLSAVRVHQGGAAPAVGALAYAQGDDVHFAPGRFQPGTPDGDRLIGHEVAHVVQQREGRVAVPQHKGAVVADAALEAEADAFGDRAARGEGVGQPVRAAQPAGGGGVQRQGDAQGTVARLNAIAATAHGYADELAPKAALGPAPGSTDPDPARIQTIKQDLDSETQEVDRISTGSTDDGVVRAATAANDAIVAARQAIAVRGGDSVAQKWADPKADHDTMLHGIRNGAAGGGGDNYCGEFCKATFVGAGLSDFATPSGSHFRGIFNYTGAVEAFFRYHPDINNRNPLYILPHNDPAQGWQTVQAYHAKRNSMRIVVERATVEAAQASGTLDSLLRPGDVVTLYLNGADPSVADHTAMIRRVIDGKTFETIEGNNDITTAAGAYDHGIGTNEWDSLATPNKSRTFESTTKVGTEYGRIFLVGRLSAVDFEAGHGYSLTDPTAGQATPAAKPKK